MKINIMPYKSNFLNITSHDALRAYLPVRSLNLVQRYYYLAPASCLLPFLFLFRKSWNDK